MIQKKFSPTNCRVTFEAPEEIAQGADTLYLVGDFNQWDAHATPMNRHKRNKFTVTLNLEPNREYQYRYLVNGQVWYSEKNADKLAPNPFFSQNSVVSTSPTEALQATV